MNNTTLNFNITGSSTNSTTPFTDLMDCLFTSLIFVNTLVGLPTHSYIIWLIVTGSESGIALEFFNLNLSVCEIGICLDCFVKMLANRFSFLQGFAACLLGLGITGRPLFHCLICLERYLAVVHPVTFLKFKPLRYKVICCTAVWIISLGSCLACTFLLVILHALDIHTWLFSVQSLVYFSIELFCLSAVLRVLKQSGPGERRREKEEENHMKRRAFNLILVTTVNMLITYVLIAVSGLYNILSQHYVDQPYLFIVVCFVLAGFVHPVFYLHRAGKLCCFCSLLLLPQ